MSDPASPHRCPGEVIADRSKLIFFATRLEDRDLEVMLQRRGGLELSAASAAHDALERAGELVDRKGDKLANGGEYNRRHNATLRAGADMVRAGAVGAIVLGDKEKPELTNMLNDGHVLDFAELDGDPDGGGDVIYEVKVPTPLKKKYSEGNGSAAGGQPASVGHIHGFGSTLEEYSKLTYGLKQRGSPRDRPFDHKSGKGYVPPTQGPLPRRALCASASSLRAAARFYSAPLCGSARPGTTGRGGWSVLEFIS